MSVLSILSSAATSPAIAPQQGQLQLNDIHVPEQVSSFPIAYGWWIILFIAIITLVWFAKKFRKNSKLQQSKKHALKSLHNKMDIAETISLLKWAAMQYFDRSEVANLYGTSFQKFLIKQLPEKHQSSFDSLSSEAFKAQYQQSDDSMKKSIESQCQQAAKLWLTYALPVKCKEQKL